MRLVFMGTPEFAVPTLRLLAASQHELAAVVTNPDRGRGRGRKTAPSPVKTAAQDLDLPVLQPDSLVSPVLLGRLEALEADLFVVVAFSILPQPLLRIPHLGSVNLHPSLLPKYRGAAPITWAVVRGETETGVTTFLLNPHVDAGDILLQRPVTVDPDETAGELQARLADIGARVVLETVDGLAAGTLRPTAQPAGQATRAPKLTKGDGRIDWTRPASELRNQIRGMNPVPGAFTEWRGGLLKVHRAELVDRSGRDVDADPGTVLHADSRLGLVVAAGRNALRLTWVQPQGKKAMDGSDFVRGYDISQGDRFGALVA